MHFFYTPDIYTAFYTFNEQESKHCARVLRLKPGDRVILVNGKGGFYQAEIVESDIKRTKIYVLNIFPEYEKRNHYLHIAIAPTKNIDRIEWFLEKATEIGIDEISLLVCERSEHRVVNLERLNKVIISAMKQSQKAYLPKLNPEIDFKRFIEEQQASQKFIAHCSDSERKSLKNCIKKNGDYIILVGPEGDFTSQELNLAIQEAYQPISLGTSRLRTETAALESCFEINFLNR